jgi:tetratricopeptide (TPR) repeat protein
MAALDNSRIEALQRMLEARPADARARFGLALEYERLELWEDVVTQLRAYLASSDDEGNAHGRLARALLKLDRPEEARVAYQAGIAAASRHGHPTLAMELEEELDEL